MYSGSINGDQSQTRIEDMTYEQLRAERRDLRKELAIYLRVLPMQASVRQELLLLADKLELTSFFLGQMSLDKDMSSVR